MKTWMKILFWLGVGGGLGYFTGCTVTNNKRDKIQNEACNSCQQECGNCELMQMWKEIDEEKKKEKAAEYVRKQYAGENAIDYSKNPEGAATDEEPEMIEETPVIGDEDTIESASRIFYISEEEYYTNSSGVAQEELIFYRNDEVLWNKDTQSTMSEDEIARSIGKETIEMLKTNTYETGLFVKNDLIPALFRIDVYDAAYTDEHGDTSEVYEED